MKYLRETFRNIKRRYDGQASGRTDLLCKEGFHNGCPVLKLLKASWTNDSMRKASNQTGIFFSVWLDAKGIARNRAHYNIHALKLRQLKAYSITSIDFAKKFRIAFRPLLHLWPNVSIDYGPQTLMQGWIEINPKNVERDVLSLMAHFADATWIIDDLLVRRHAPSQEAVAVAGKRCKPATRTL